MKETECSMRFLRFIALLLAVVVFTSFPLTAKAAEISTGSMGVIIHDREKNDRINELMVQRSKLELNYEENKELIDQIDHELQQLGVETVSSVEILNKLGGAVPAIDVPSTDTVQWTSRRLVVTYSGKHYELQIYEGIPISTNSPLITEQVVVTYEAKGIVAGVANALKILGIEALGAAVDELSNVEELADGIKVLNAFLTAQEIKEEFREALSTSTVFENVTGSVTTAFVTHMRYIFVKPYETEDYGNQALCYIGNSVSYEIGTMSTVWLQDDVEPNPEMVVTRLNGTSNSSYYDDFSLPAKNYHNYRYNGVTDYTDDYCMMTITFEFFGSKLEFDVPRVDLF